MTISKYIDSCPCLRVFLIFTFALSASAASADNSMRGKLPEEQRAIIQYMAEHHHELERTVTLTDDGYAATTTTSNEVLADKLQEHFKYMEQRLGSGVAVRRWDPAFREMLEYHDALKTKVEYIEGGIRVVVTGDSPEAIKVARNHARVVTDFTERGAAGVRDRHDAALAP